MIHAGHFSALTTSVSGALLLVGNTVAQCRRTSEKVAVRGYAVDAVGMAEALWCWPIDGYDLVLIDATEQPGEGAELCDYIKQSRPGQKVVMLVGHRSGRLPFKLKADAVFSGEPEGPELARALHFLLREHSSPVRI